MQWGGWVPACNPIIEIQSNQGKSTPKMSHDLVRTNLRTFAGLPPQPGSILHLTKTIQVAPSHPFLAQPQNSLPCLFLVIIFFPSWSSLDAPITWQVVLHEVEPSHLNLTHSTEPLCHIRSTSKSSIFPGHLHLGFPLYQVVLNMLWSSVCPQLHPCPSAPKPPNELMHKECVPKAVCMTSASMIMIHDNLCLKEPQLSTATPKWGALTQSICL
jgi:hypothetical protein